MAENLRETGPLESPDARQPTEWSGGADTRALGRVESRAEARAQVEAALREEYRNAVGGLEQAAEPDDAGELPDATLGEQPLLQRHGHDLPDPRALTYERGPDGLIDRIDARPVREFVQDLSQQRNDLYRQMQTDRTELPDGTERSEHFTRASTGRMHSVLLDRRTGEFFEADNRTLPYEEPTNLHPTLQNELNRMHDFAEQHPDHYDYGGRGSGRFPHPDIPGTHSEVAAANQALRAREAAGHPAGPDALRELTVDNRRLFGGGAGSQAECCANCTRILGDIEAIPGKKTEFP